MKPKIFLTRNMPDQIQKLLRADWDNAGTIVRASGARVE